MLAVVCAMFVVVPAPRAFAHGPTPDATNYRSAVTDVVDRDGAPARLQDVIWTVLGGDGLLQVCTAGDAEVVVAGYNAEWYLRVGPDGVFENRNSPAVYLNADRYGNVTVPPDIDPSAAPDWRRIADDRQWQWHDHRIHWMAPTPPPAVGARPGVEQEVLTWAVPFQVADRRLEARGVLDFVPPPVWPWLVGAALMLSLPVAGLAVARAGDQHGRRVPVAHTVIVAGGGVAVAVGDALATPAGVGANVWAVVQTAVPAGIALALASTALRDPSSEDAVRPTSTLVVAAVIVGVTIGVTRLGQLTSSQITNALPEAFVRGSVAAALAPVVPAAVNALAQRRHWRAT